MLHMQACVNTYSYILLHAYFVLSFYRNAVNDFMRMSIHKETHTRMSVLVHGHVSLCGAKMLHRQLRALIDTSLLSKTVASTTYLHTPFSAPKTYMCICASLWLKNKPLSSQTRPTYACTCVHILICTCIRLITATVLDKCLHVCRAARLQDKMHSIISQSVRVQ